MLVSSTGHYHNVSASLNTSLNIYILKNSITIFYILQIQYYNFLHFRCSSVFWLTNCCFTSEKVDYILKYMQIAESNDKKRRAKLLTQSTTSHHQRDSIDCKELGFLPDSYLLHKFVCEFLKTDGIFTLRLMANHAGELCVVHVVRALWREFCERNWKEIEEYSSFRLHTMKGNHSRRDSSANHRKVMGMRMEQST